MNRERVLTLELEISTWLRQGYRKSMQEIG